MSIEGTLFKSNYVGKDGFVWWIGRVADSHTWLNKNHDKSFSGEDAFRCKVRIIGYHPFDNTLKEEDLPWATVMMDASGGNGINGPAKTQQLYGGETCVGFFLDGEDGQQPVVIGLLHRNASVKASTTAEENIKEKSSRFKNLPINRESSLNRNPTLTSPIAPTTASTGIGASAGNGISAYCLSGGASAGHLAFESKMTQTVVTPSPCKNDFIGRITQIIQDFIGFISILENGITGFINPVLNRVVDLTSSIKSFANQIGGIVKLIINSIRSSLFKCIVSLFKKVLGLNKKTNPEHILVDAPAKKATSNILKLIYCLLEDLIDEIIDFIIKMLTGMVGKIVNPSICAAEQFTSAILAKVMKTIDKLLQPILSGVSWLTGGIGKVLDILGQVSTLATEIFNFIGDCGSIKCTQPSKWISSTSAALKMSADNWQKQINNINILDGATQDLVKISDAIGGDIQLTGVAGKTEISPGVFNVDYTTIGGNIFTRQEDADGNYIVDNQVINKNQIEGILGTVDTLTGGNSLGKLGSLEGAISGMTMFGGSNSIYSQCNESTFNPTSQNDLGELPLGYKYDYCIPPIAEVVGDGEGATVLPIVGDDGKIFSVEIITSGLGYTEQTEIAIIDNSKHGSSAKAKAIIDSKGRIENIVVINPGSGYCQGNYTIIRNNQTGESGIGTESGAGIGTTSLIGTESGAGIGTTSTQSGISSSVSGIITSFYVDRPGLGYTSGDTIGIGSTNVSPVLTANGSIISIVVPTDFNEIFTSPPLITINTKTGVGANIKPIMKFVPQTIVASKSTVTNQNQLISIKDCP